MDLTLRDGINLKEAIHMAQELDQQSKAAGFEQDALDYVARQGFANAVFEEQEEEHLVEEFYSDLDTQSEQTYDQATQPPNHIQEVATLQQNLKRSVQSIN